MELNIFTKFFLGTLFLKNLIEGYLDKRNYEHIYANQNVVPPKFKDQISLSDHQKAAQYTMTKIKTRQYFHFFDLIVFLVWTLGGGIEALSQLSMHLGNSETTTALIFFGLLGLISSFLSLPESLYSTFVIEEKFGFNKTTIKTYILDMIKVGLLSILLGTPLIIGLLKIMEKMDAYWWIYAFIFLSSIQLLILFIYPTFIAPLFNTFTPLEEGEVKEKITTLLKKANFKANGLFVMDASKRSGHGNAYFTGFGKNKRIVFFDTLINGLTPSEIEAVLAHEIGHMKKRHILKAIIKSFIFSFISFYILSILKRNPDFFNGHGLMTITNYTVITMFSMVSSVYTFFITPISSYFSRKQEYEADQFAAEYSSASELVSSLVKMYKDNASSLTPDPIYSKFYYSHPPALERVNYLESLKN